MRIGRDGYALALAALVPLGVYVASATREVGFWDIGEMDTVPWIAGIAHPTGFPAFVMLGWLWTHALPIGSVAFRMSLLSAVSMSLTAGLIAWSITRAFNAPWVGMAAAWLFAFGDIAWTRATRAEVHALAALTIVATIAFALEWYRTRSRPMFFAAAAAWGIGLATHPVAVLILPGLIILLIARAHDVRWRDLLAAAGLVTVIVLGAYAYLPLRSWYVTAHELDPTVALGIPPGRPFWDYHHPSTLHGFYALVSGSDFDVLRGLRSIVTPAIYFQHGIDYFEALVHELSYIGVLFVVCGIAIGLTRDRWRTIGLLLCGLACIPFALGYPQEADIRRYFLTSFIVAAVFIGEAGAWLSGGSRLTRALVPVALAGVAVWLVWSQRPLFQQPYDVRARQVIKLVQQYTPPNAIIVSSWTYATPIAYAAYVEKSMGNRTIEPAWLEEDADYIPYWVRMRPVYLVDGGSGVPGFRLRHVPGAPLPLYQVLPQ